MYEYTIYSCICMHRDTTTIRKRLKAKLRRESTRTQSVILVAEAAIARVLHNPVKIFGHPGVDSRVVGSRTTIAPRDYADLLEAFVVGPQAYEWPTRVALTAVTPTNSRIAGAHHILCDHLLRVVRLGDALLVVQHWHLHLLQQARRLAILLERAPAGGNGPCAHKQIIALLHTGQTDGANEAGDRHAIVEAQQRNVIVKVGETEFLAEGAQHKARLGALLVVAAIVLAEGHLDHEPHESLNAVRRRQHVAIVDQCPAAVETIEVAQAGHPRVLADAGCGAPHNSRLIVALSTSARERERGRVGK